MPITRIRGLLSLWVCCLLFAAPSAAQCSAQWLPGAGAAGTNGGVAATSMWDPDGAGPRSPVLVVGGSFTLAGNVAARNIATYDPASGAWEALGSGVGDGTTSTSVYAISVLPGGDLVVGGLFPSAGGVSCFNIARWNGISWSPLGSGMNNSVFALATLANGDLVAGGAFSSAGGVLAQKIARWNGASWSPIGAGTNDSVSALAVTSSGDIIAGGSFTVAGGASINRIARWDGVSWSAFGAGTTGPVQSVALMPNGDLVIGGQFSTAGGVVANGIARWNGTSWSALGTGMAFIGPLVNASVLALLSMPNGDLIAGGTFNSAGGVPANYVARWNGASWTSLANGVGSTVLDLLAAPNGDIIAGLSTTLVGIVRWNGASWSPLLPGTDGPINGLATLPNGLVVAGGSFSMIDGVSAAGVAQWNGTGWQALGAGPGIGVNAVSAAANGDIFAGSSSVRRWDGTTWSTIGTVNGAVYVLFTLPSGDVVAAGDFTQIDGVAVGSIARWDGTTWSAMGAGLGPDSQAAAPGVFALLALPNGDIVAGGGILGPSGIRSVARWNGSTWSAMGTGFTYGVFALGMLSNGDVVASEFDNGSIVRWNGASWVQLGLSYPGALDIETLPNGDLLVAGDQILRWDGSTWIPFGSQADGTVAALAVLTNGDVFAGGHFSAIDGQISAYVALRTTTCPGAAVAYGAGCVGLGGQLSLVPDNRPWAGGVLSATASGFGPQSLGLGIASLGQIPAGTFPINPGLLGIVPGPGIGCDLLVASLDYMWFLFPTLGTATWTVPIPSAQINPAIAGLTFYMQVAELDSLNGWTNTYSSNGITCTIGGL